MVGHKTEAIYRRCEIPRKKCSGEAPATLEILQAMDQQKQVAKYHAKMEFSRKARACNWLNSKERGCGQGQNRTADTRIFSPLLYRLSYLARSLEYSLKVTGSQD